MNTITYIVLVLAALGLGVVFMRPVFAYIKAWHHKFIHNTADLLIFYDYAGFQHRTRSRIQDQIMAHVAAWLVSTAAATALGYLISKLPTSAMLIALSCMIIAVAIPAYLFGMRAFMRLQKKLAELESTN